MFLIVLAIAMLSTHSSLLRGAHGRRVSRLVCSRSQSALGSSQFIDIYRARGPARLVLFEAGVGPLLEQTFATGETVYVDYDDRGAQAQVRWHAAEEGLPQTRVVILPDGGIPPVGSTVFARFQECDYACERFAFWEEYWLARAVGPAPG